MRNLLNFFFSFDKLMKEKLVRAFYWLALIVAGIAFAGTAFESIRLGPLASVLEFVNFFAGMLLTLVGLRLICEIAVAIFRINNNLSPDGGRSETADIDPLVEARKAAEAAAARAREVTKTAGEKAQAATKSARETTQDMAGNIQAKSRAKSPATKTKTVSAKGAAVKKPTAKKASTKTSSAKSTATKKRGRPAGSKNKTTAAKTKATTKRKTTAKKVTTGKKRGPKPGTKVRRDAQGRLLKKDGTLRAKPGPKKS